MMNHRKKRQMASDSPSFPTLSLPDFDSFDDDEKLLGQVTIGIVRHGGALFRGRFIEVVVARLSHATSDRGIDRK